MITTKSYVINPIWYDKQGDFLESQHEECAIAYMQGANDIWAAVFGSPGYFSISHDEHSVKFSVAAHHTELVTRIRKYLRGKATVRLVKAGRNQETT